MIVIVLKEIIVNRKEKLPCVENGYLLSNLQKSTKKL